MKIYFNSDFTITKREYEEYFLGSEYHNKIEVYFPMTTYGNYTYIYPVFNVKRPDDRKFGEFALTEYNVENDYIVWRADLPAKALEVEGTLEITILFRYSTDNKYAKVSTGKVLLNVKEAVIGEENDVIFTGSGDNLQGEIDAIRNEFGVRFDNVETRFISDLAELDGYTTPGVYKINFNNNNVFHLFVYGYENEFTQIRSSSGGYYSREYDNGVWTEWSRRNYAFTDNLKTINGESIIGKGNIDVKAEVNLDSLDARYVQKESGKGLSSNDYTNEEKNKLARLDEKITDVVEIAEGKTNTYVLSYNETIETLKEKLKTNTEHKVYDADGNDITAGIKNGDYDSYRIVNNIFSSDSEIVYEVNGYFITFNDIEGRNGDEPYGSSYAILPLPHIAKKLKTGDILYITEVDVPDRWYGGGATPAMFHKMETSKVDLSNYLEKNNLKTINGESIVGKGNIVIKGADVDLSNYYNIPTTNALLAAKEDKSNLKALAYKDSLSKSDIGLGNVRNVESYSKTETDENIANVVEIAEGKTNSYVLKWFNNPFFESNEDVIRINLKDNPILDSSGAAVPNTALKIGDIFYIIETNVPDRWLAGIDRDVYTFAKMETSKVNLDGYATNTDVDNKIANAIGNALEADY